MINACNSFQKFGFHGDYMIGLIDAYMIGLIDATHILIYSVHEDDYS